MSIRILSSIVPVLSIVLLIGCGEKPAVGPGAPGTAPAAGPAATAPGSASDPVELQRQETARSLTDEKLAKFAAYRKEMIPAMGLVVGTIGSKGTAREDNAKRFEAAQGEACKKVGIQQKEIQGLTLLTTDYYSQTWMGPDAEKQVASAQKKLDEAKAAGKGPDAMSKILLDAHSETLTKIAGKRKEYETKYGKPVLDILSKHEAEFAEIIGQEMKAFLKKPAEKE